MVLSHESLEAIQRKAEAAGQSVETYLRKLIKAAVKEGNRQ